MTGLPVMVLRPGARARRVPGLARGGSEALDLATRDGEAPIGQPETRARVWIVRCAGLVLAPGRYPGDPLDAEARARDLELAHDEVTP